MNYSGMLLTGVLAISLAGATAAEPTQGYRIRKGDGLDAIARRHHTSRATLLRLNPLVSPDNLDIGAVVRVPAQAGAAPRTRRASDNRSPVTITPVSVRSSSASAASPITRSASTPATSQARPAQMDVAKAAPAKPSAAPVATAPRGTSAADTADPYKYDEPRKNDGDMPIGRVVIDLIWKLAVVLGIAYLAIYLLRGIMGRQVGLPGQKGNLRVLESATLGPNRAVHLVRVGGKILVLGSTPDQITAIGEMDEAEVNTASAPAPAAVPPAFSGHLAEAVSGEKGGALPEQFHGGIRHIWDQVQQIRGLRGKGPNA